MWQLRADIYLYNLVATVPILHSAPLCYARSIFESVSRYVLKVKAKFGPRGIIKFEFLMFLLSLHWCNTISLLRGRSEGWHQIMCGVHITIECTLLLTTDICYLGKMLRLHYSIIHYNYFFHKVRYVHVLCTTHTQTQIVNLLFKKYEHVSLHEGHSLNLTRKGWSSVKLDKT